MANRWGKIGNSDRFYFLEIQNHCGWWQQPWKKKSLAHWKKSYDKPRQHIRKQRHHFADKGTYNQSYGFSSSQVQRELYHKEGWARKNWCFRTGMLEKTLESPLDSKEINHSILKEMNPEYSLEGLMLKLKLQYFGHLMWRVDSLGKKPHAGKDWRQEKKGTTEDEMVVWHHEFNGHEFEQALGNSEGQGNLACCSPWGHKDSEMTVKLNRNSNNSIVLGMFT